MVRKNASTLHCMDTIELFKSALWCNRHLWQDLNKKLVSVADWNKIDNLAELHGLIPQLLYAIKAQKQETLLPPHIAEKWNKESLHIAAENICKLTVLKEIVAILNANNIPIVLLRGISSAWSRYPTPELRPMADIDILVPHKKLSLAVKLLQKKGYLPVKSGEWNFCHPNFNNVVIDLHINCFPWYSHKDMELLWKNAKPSVFFSSENVFVLPNEETLITEACHAVLCHGFPKLLWLEDIALVIKEGIIWERFWDIAKQMKVIVPLNLYLKWINNLTGSNHMLFKQKKQLKNILEKKLLDFCLPSYEKHPIQNIGHLLSFVWLNGFYKKLLYLKERFIPSNKFLMRRYGNPSLKHLLFFKIIRPLLTFWKTIILLTKIIKKI